MELQNEDGTKENRRVNQSKLRKNPDNWHDVVIPGLDRRNDVPTVPERKTDSNEPVKFKRNAEPEIWPDKEEGPSLNKQLLPHPDDQQARELFGDTDDEFPDEFD